MIVVAVWCALVLAVVGGQGVWWLVWVLARGVGEARSQPRSPPRGGTSPRSLPCGWAGSGGEVFLPVGSSCGPAVSWSGERLG